MGTRFVEVGKSIQTFTRSLTRSKYTHTHVTQTNKWYSDWLRLYSLAQYSTIFVCWCAHHIESNSEFLWVKCIQFNVRNDRYGFIKLHLSVGKSLYSIPPPALHLPLQIGMRGTKYKFYFSARKCSHTLKAHGYIWKFHHLERIQAAVCSCDFDARDVWNSISKKLYIVKSSAFIFTFFFL